MSDGNKSTHDRLEAVEVKSKENETVQAWMMATAKKLGLANFIVLVTFATLVIGAYSYQSRAWAQDMKGISDAGIQPVNVKVDALIEQAKDQKEFNREVLRLIGELGADNRAIYRRIETGDRQPRLERPLPVPDGGP